MELAEYGKYSALDVMNSSKGVDYTTPEELSNKLHIGLKTVDRTLKSKMYHFILSTVLFTIHFSTDKAHLRYKQLARNFGSFNTEYLKLKTKSIRGYVGGIVYTNQLVYYKFIPCDNKTSENTGRCLRRFIEIFVLPYSLHLDNHRIFKDGIFKVFLKKFGGFQTFTEPHSPWKNQAEPEIVEIKRHERKIMQASNIPVQL